MIGPVASARLVAPQDVVRRSTAAVPQTQARRPIADVVSLSAAAREDVGTGSVARAATRAANAFDGGAVGAIRDAAAAVQAADGADTRHVLEEVEKHARSFSGGTGAEVRRAAGIGTHVGAGFAAAKAFAAYQHTAHGG